MAVVVKQAKVFEMILSKAAKNMEQASDQMIERIKKAETRFEFPFPKDQLDDENKAQALILDEQKSAKDRLERLVAALKAEIEASKNRSAKAENDDGGGDGGPDQQPKKGGIQAQDGIPALAQLKALRGEQLEVNNQTKEFHERHPDPALLTPEEQVQINQLRAEQDALFQLFGEMVKAANQNQGGNPENQPGPKQGEKQ